MASEDSQPEPAPARPKVRLTGVQATMLVTLMSRVVDAKNPKPILGDAWAQKTMDKIDYDFTKIRLTPWTTSSIIVRAHQLDEWAQCFLDDHPDAMVVHLACGIDTRCFRLKWGPTTRWIDIDLPDVVELRKQLLPRPEGDYELRTPNILGEDWPGDLPNDRPTLVIVEGLCVYLQPSEGESLFRRLGNHFTSGLIIGDLFNPIMLHMQFTLPMLKDTGSHMVWGVRNPRALEKLSPKLKLKEALRVAETERFRDLPLHEWAFWAAMWCMPIFRNLLWIVKIEIKQ